MTPALRRRGRRQRPSSCVLWRCGISIAVAALFGCSSGTPGTAERDAAGAERACTETDPEPNDLESEAMPIELSPPRSCDDVVMVTGTVNGADVDYHRAPGITTNGILCDRVRAFFLTTSAGLEVCLFSECAIMDGPEPFEQRCEHGDEARSPDGRFGCCSRDGEASLHVICSEGSGTLVNYYMRVRQPDSAACYPYELRLDYV